MTIILVGLPPGLHHILIELADPTHKVIARQTVDFTTPAIAVSGGPSAAR